VANLLLMHDPNQSQICLDIHVLHLGKLVGNFQSLEFMLRAFLSKLPGALPPAVPFGEDVYSRPVGTELPVSDLTSYESLDDLITRYNFAVIQHELGDPLDPSLVDLRDALAHGRISAKQDGHTLRLLKFDRPNKSEKVRITFNEEMTEEWFKSQISRVHIAILDAAKSDHEAMLKWPQRKK